VLAQLFFDTEELVILSDAVGAAEGTSLDLASVEGHSDVRNRRIFCFAGAVGDDGGVASALGHGHGVEGLGERTDLVHLHEDRVSGFSLDPAREELGVGDEEVVADELGVGTHRDGGDFQPFQSASEKPSSIETIG